MSNLLFSRDNTMSYIIVSPYFLDINTRFRYSLENTNCHYFNDTKVYKENNNLYSLYTRVKINNKSCNDYNKVGEIVHITEDNKYSIALSNNDVAGFNNNIKFREKTFKEKDFDTLDRGLNSPYTFDFTTLINRL